MDVSTWKRRLASALGAAALGVCGTALAAPPEEAEAEVGNPDRVPTITEAQKVVPQEPGTGENPGGRWLQLWTADQLSTQEPGTGGSGGGMVDASEVSNPLTRTMGPLTPRPQITVTLDAGLVTYLGGLGDVTMIGTGFGGRLGARFWENLGLDLEDGHTRTGVPGEFAPQNGSVMYRNAGDLVLTGGRAFESGLRPYGGLGFGLGWFNPNDQAEQDGFTSDMFWEMPFVAGVDYQAGALYGGLRASWRWFFGEEFANQVRGENTEGSLLGLSLNVGGRF